MKQEVSEKDRLTKLLYFFFLIMASKHLNYFHLKQKRNLMLHQLNFTGL